MGLLQEGKWVDRWYNTNKTGGRFVRRSSQFRNWITTDGNEGPSGKSGFKAEAGRYHLYVSLACPWAHRTLIFRSIKGLENMVSLSVVNWFMADNKRSTANGANVNDRPPSSYHSFFRFQISPKQNSKSLGAIPLMSALTKFTNCKYCASLLTIFPRGEIAFMIP